MMLPFILSCLKPLGLNAQSFTTQGTDFWVAIMPCWLDNDVDNYHLMISAPRSCSVTISNPNTGWSHTMSISAGSTRSYQLPNAHSWQAGSCIVTNMGLHITSTDIIQLWAYIQSQTASSCDATHILPTTALGSEYIVQTTPVDHSYSQQSHAEFSVLATEDSTVVDIVLTNNTSTGIGSGTTITRTLNAGQIFQVMGPHRVGDFSGTTVRARECKRIAVFSGATATNMPYGNNTSSDQTYQQAIPTTSCGRQWVLTPSAWHDTSDYVRITAIHDSCHIYRNGIPLAVIDNGQTYQFKLNAPALITTSYPSILYQYLDSRHCAGTGCDWGDVASFAPNHVDQSTQSCVFSCFDVRSRGIDSKYYINVVVPTAESGLMRLDGAPLTGFSTIAGTNYSYIRQSITNASHTLTTTGTGFSAFTYGLGENWEAYAMSLGGTDTATQFSAARLVIIDSMLCADTLVWRGHSLGIPGTHRIPPQSDHNGCDTTFFFRLTKYVSATVNIDTALCANTLLWGDTLLQVPGLHTLRYTASDGCDSIVNINLIRTVAYIDTIDTSFCSRQVSWDDTTLSIPGFHTLHYATIDGCDSIVCLNTQLAAESYYHVDTNICTSSYRWQDTTLDVPGSYTFFFIDSRGCDSIVTLNLHYVLAHEFTIDTATCHLLFSWSDSLLDVPGSYDFSYTASDGCDSIVHLDISLTDGHEITITTSTCLNPFPWQDTLLSVPGTYVFTYTASDGCDSTVHLELSVSEGYETFFDTASCDNLILWMDTVFDVPGSYEVHLTASDGCDSTVHLKILYYPSYETFDTLRLHGEQLDTTINGQTYTIGDQFDRTLQTTLGCDSIIHTLLVGDNCHPFIWIPNVFTPFQPTNNIFCIQSQNITEMTVSIYQRWGDCIHTFDGLTEGWNGTLRGQPCQEGAYVYLIRYKTTCTPNPKTLAGTVTILH